PGEVVVRIEAAGVNPLDAKRRSGARPMPPITEPRRVGFDGAGVVEALGDGVTGFAIGDRVAVHDGDGTYASHIAIAASKLDDLPDAVTARSEAHRGGKW